MVASGSWNEPLRLWDLATGQLVGEFGGEPEGRTTHSPAFHPTEPILLTGTNPGHYRIHTLDIDELIEIAESRLTREMTEEECQQYLRRSCDEN